MSARSIDKKLAQAILDEEARRSRVDLLEGLTPKQRTIIEDPSLQKAILGTRRGGKSWLIGIYLFKTALDFPGSTCLYLGLYKHSAVGVMNQQIFQVINKRYKLGGRWLDNKGEWHMPNGSIIRLRGADAGTTQVDSVVGQKYRLFILDEASKFKQDLYHIYNLVLPAMGDDLGTIVLAGTPSNRTAGLFYDLTATPKHPKGWSVYFLNWRDNYFIAKNLKTLHDEITLDPKKLETADYKREWLGQWVIDNNILVYRYDVDKNLIDELPFPAKEYLYVLGCDTGFKDADAWTVVAYHKNDPTLYIVYAFKQRGLTLTGSQDDPGFLNYVNALDARHPSYKLPDPMTGVELPKFNFVRYIIDAPLKMTEEIRQRHRIPFESPEKIGGVLGNTNKRGVIEIFNGDLEMGRIKVLPAARSLLEEWDKLIWDEKKRAYHRYQEDEAFDNHICDSTLYSWRASRNYNVEPIQAAKPIPGTEAYADYLFEQEFKPNNGSASDNWLDAEEQRLGRDDY